MYLAAIVRLIQSYEFKCLTCAKIVNWLHNTSVAQQNIYTEVTKALLEQTQNEQVWRQVFDNRTNIFYKQTPPDCWLWHPVKAGGRLTIRSLCSQGRECLTEYPVILNKDHHQTQSRTFSAQWAKAKTLQMLISGSQNLPWTCYNLKITSKWMHFSFACRKRDIFVDIKIFMANAHFLHNSQHVWFSSCKIWSFLSCF